MIDTSKHYELLYNNWLCPTGEQIQFIRIPKLSLEDTMSKYRKLKNKKVYFIVSKNIGDDISWDVCSVDFNAIDISNFKYTIISSDVHSRNKSGKIAKDLADSNNGVFIGEIIY